MAFSAMSTFWQLNTHFTIPNVTITNGTGGAHQVYTYFPYTIIVVSAGTVIVKPNYLLTVGYLVVGPGGIGLGNGASGGVVKVGTIASNAITIAANSTATLTIGLTATYINQTVTPGTPSTISGTSTNVTCLPGANSGYPPSIQTATSGYYNSATPNVTYGKGGQSTGTALVVNGNPGFDFSLHKITDINLISGYVGGGGGGYTNVAGSIYAGSGGTGGGGGGVYSNYMYGTGGPGPVTFDTSATFGYNGTNASAPNIPGNGGINTGGGGGGGGTYSGGPAGLGGSGVILIYYTTPTTPIQGYVTVVGGAYSTYGAYSIILATSTSTNVTIKPNFNLTLGYLVVGPGGAADSGRGGGGGSVKIGTISYASTNVPLSLLQNATATLTVGAGSASTNNTSRISGTTVAVTCNSGNNSTIGTYNGVTTASYGAGGTNAQTNVDGGNGVSFATYPIIDIGLTANYVGGGGGCYNYGGLSSPSYVGKGGGGGGGGGAVRGYNGGTGGAGTVSFGSSSFGVNGANGIATSTTAYGGAGGVNTGGGGGLGLTDSSPVLGGSGVIIVYFITPFGGVHHT